MNHAISYNQQNQKVSLQCFNQIPNKSTITILNFSNCKINVIPPDLSQFTNLTSLDISNNPLTNLDLIGQSLATLPNLRELNITFPSPSSLKVLLSYIPNLQLVNNQPVQSLLRNIIDLTNDEIKEATLEIEITHYKTLLKKISMIPVSMEKKYNFEQDAFQAEFSSFLNSQYVEVNKIINDIVPNYVYGIKLLKIKIEIYQFFQNKVISLINHYNGTNTISNLLEILLSINNMIKEKETLMTHLITMLSDKICNSTLNENNAKEIGVLKAKLNEKSTHNNLLEQENKTFKEKILRLEEENKVILSKCFIKAKMIQMDKIICLSKPKEENKTGFNCSSSNGFMSPIKQNIPRVITKECLLDIIQDIYTSKIAANSKCRANNVPLDTLERHMYKYLNQKYGLKSIILEYATSIIQAIKDYSISNSEICLFGKILRNEIEEGSITLLRKIKESVSDALIYFLQQKHKPKDFEEIQMMANQLKTSLIEETLWLKIIDFLFRNNTTDRDTIKNKIYSFIQKVMNESIQKKATELNNRNIVSYKQMKQEKMLIDEISSYQKKIAYNDLLDIVLSFHIRTRDKYLKNFQKTFAIYDKDKNGVISEDAFCSLIIGLDIYPKEVINAKLDLFLNQLPQHNCYSFSEIVDLLENDRVSQTLSAMDSIAMKSF